MTRAVKLRDDYSASDLRRLAARSQHANAARRLLALAAIRDGANRTDAARVGGMDRQTLRDWVHRFNAEGPDGLRDYQHAGPRLSADQRYDNAWLFRAICPARGKAAGLALPFISTASMQLHIEEISRCSSMQGGTPPTG